MWAVAAIQVKKEVVDTGPQSSEQAYFDKAQKALDRGQYLDATKSLEAIDTYYPTGQYAQQAQLELLYSKFKQKIMKVRLHSQNVLFV